MSLFSGSPQQAPSYTTSTTETPKWMQDAIYNQIQWAQNVANAPFQQYALPRVAELSPLQQQAYADVQTSQGAWKPTMEVARTGLERLGAADTASALRGAQSGYLQPGMPGAELAAGQQLFTQAGGLNAPAAAQGALSAAQQVDPTAAAAGYLGRAGAGAYENVGSYMSPYQQAVADQIAKQGARNLSENLLPAVSDAFIRAGQFGSGRMGEFGSRALRDTQEAVLREQAGALQQGYGQALQASQADLARQAQLGSTAGGLAAQRASALANIGQTQGQLTAQQMQNLASLGQARLGAGQAQQQLGLSAAQAAANAQGEDYQRQAAALNQLAQQAQTAQGMRLADVAALETAGLSSQQQAQRLLDAGYQQFQEARNYPKQQLDWLSTQVRGLAPITPQTTTQQGFTTQYGPSPLSQLASGYLAYKGLTGP